MQHVEAYPSTPLAHGGKECEYDGRTYLIAPQPYARHVVAVRKRAKHNAEKVSLHMRPPDRNFFVTVVSIAATYHDMGKLVIENQKALGDIGWKGNLPKWHSIVGEQFLLKHAKTIESRWAAMLIACHHRGLYNLSRHPEIIRPVNYSPSRADPLPMSMDKNHPGYADAETIAFCLRIHNEHVPTERFAPEFLITDVDRYRRTLRDIMSPMMFRMALGCLAEADRRDTSNHFHPHWREQSPRPFHPRERLLNLKRVLENKKGGQIKIEDVDPLLDSILAEQKAGAISPVSMLRDHRQKLRRIAGVVAENYELPEGITLCNFPVGSGKTLSLLRNMLANASASGSNFSRIFYISPFTSIIDQVYMVMTQHLVLPGDWHYGANKKSMPPAYLSERQRTEYIAKHSLDREMTHSMVVCRHDHRSEYKNKGLRQFSTRWATPIVVTTAVQFFETLASNAPAKLAKLPNLAGSLIFIDEYHSCLRDELVKVGFQWLSQLVVRFGCRIIIGSGSPIDYWQIEELRGMADGVQVTDMLAGYPKLATAFENNEKHRTSVVPIGRALRPATDASTVSLDLLTSIVLDMSGPTLLVMNTLRGAAHVARALATSDGRAAWTDREVKGSHRGLIYHLSTAMTGEDRKRVIQRVFRLLARDQAVLSPPANVYRRHRESSLKPIADKMILVATSCIEAGVDLTFANTFRQNASMTSLSQVGGRGNRGYEYGKHARVFYYDLDSGCRKVVPENPHVSRSRSAMNRLMLAQAQRRRRKERMTLTADMCSMAKRMEVEQVVQAGKNGSWIQRSIEEDQWRFEDVRENFKVIRSDSLTVVADSRVVSQLQSGEGKVEFNVLQKALCRINAKYEGRLPIEVISVSTKDAWEDEEEADKNRDQDRTDDRLWRFTSSGFYTRFLGFMEGMLRVIEGDPTAMLRDDEELFVS